MNYTEIGFNLSNLTFLNKPCTGADYISAECLHKHFCPQFTKYYVNTGIFVIILYIIGTWLCWGFFSYWYKHFEFIHNEEFIKYFGDWSEFETRQYWDALISRLLSQGLLIFAVIVVLLNI